MNNFSVHKKRDVMEIGFGHLLSMKLTRTVTTMLPWLVDCFDHGSCMFLFGGKEFMIDEYDVYDVFGLPLNPSKDVVEISHTANERNPDFHIKLKWRNDFNVGPNENIKLGLIEERIKDLDMGGEEFKRMFVMHAFSSFFSPTANRTADLRIAKCLMDVDEIRTYNWSKYVLDRLCEAVRKYKNGDLDYFTGCVMLLQLVYFHRLKFRNKEVDCNLPLVQHWTDENVKDRVSSETKAVCFGCGCLDTTTYLVSKKLRFVDGQAVEYSKDLMDEVNYKGKKKSSEGHENDFDTGFSRGVPNVSSYQQSITFPLPLGTPSTEEILSRESGDVRALFLLMKRDLEVVTNFHIAALKEKVCAQLRAFPLCPLVSQIHTFFSDPKVFEMMDEIVNIVLSVKNMPGGLNEICIFLDGSSGAKNAEVKFLELAFKEDNASQVDELQNCWHEWLTVNNHGFNLDTLELIFIPIFSSNHYFLFVVNIPQKKIQFIDSLSYDKQEKCALCQLCECLADQVSMFFDGMGLVNAPYIIDYPMEFVTLNWKSSKQNVDCGLYVMMSMLLFHGSDEFSCDNLKKAPMRRVLRAKICTALVLSERNDVRSEILDKMKAMRPSRPQLQKEVEQRRKQELEDLKKNE
ncbi:Ubiquitin-like-specific protease 1A [Bienertia sinuspersici]